MLEWNISEDNAPLPSENPEPSPRRPLRISFWLILFLVVGLIVGVVTAFWWRARLVEAEIKEDLLIQIQREEQARRFGLEAQASHMVRYDLQTGERNEIWNDEMGGIQMAGIDASGGLYALTLLQDSGDVAVMKYDNEEWFPLLTDNSDDCFYYNLKMCGTGGATFLRIENSLEEERSPEGFELIIITPTGELFPEMIPLDITQFPLGC